MLGQPVFLPKPIVPGVRTRGELPPGTTATDLVLTLTQMLSAHGVVGKFVEFFGPGLSSLGLADRATLSNMSPEFGATATLFPVDANTLNRRGGDERIHRSSLVCVGVLPLQYKTGDLVASLGLDGSETFAITGLAGDIEPRQHAEVRVTRADGSQTTFEALVRIDAPAEVECFCHGGILPMVLRPLQPA